MHSAMIDLASGVILLLVLFLLAKVLSTPSKSKRHDPDWKGALRKRFRIKSLRWEHGRWCYIVHPIEGGHDIVWWEWEDNGSKDKTASHN